MFWDCFPLRILEALDYSLPHSETGNIRPSRSSTYNPQSPLSQVKAHTLFLMWSGDGKVSKGLSQFTFSVQTGQCWRQMSGSIRFLKKKYLQLVLDAVKPWLLLSLKHLSDSNSSRWKVSSVTVFRDDAWKLSLFVHLFVFLCYLQQTQGALQEGGSQNGFYFSWFFWGGVMPFRVCDWKQHRVHSLSFARTLCLMTHPIVDALFQYRLA